LKDSIDEMLPATGKVREFDLVWRVVTLVNVSHLLVFRNAAGSK